MEGTCDLHHRRYAKRIERVYDSPISIAIRMHKRILRTVSP
jgi:hypothetical protein